MVKTNHQENRLSSSFLYTTEVKAESHYGNPIQIQMVLSSFFVGLFGENMRKCSPKGGFGVLCHGQVDLNV